MGGVTLVCQECGKEFICTNRGKILKQRKFCSRSCHISDANRKRTLTESQKERLRSFQLGTHHSEETKVRMSASHMGREFSEETRKKISQSNKGKVRTSEMNQRNSFIHLGKKQTEQAKMKVSISSKKRWGDPEYKDRTVGSIVMGNNKAKNNFETAVDVLLGDCVCGEYRFVGGGRKIKIFGGRCPDFLSKDEKKVILCHGDYHHLWKLQRVNPSLTQEDVEKGDMEHYSRCGFKCLIIWLHEMKDKTKVIEKILSFHQGIA